ncbi:MAG: hypothetical protein H7A51_12125 [Akkermansiaceae bacterium]|nr:hypothetical protein [Akkermansiaceae bacterium]
MNLQVSVEIPESPAGDPPADPYWLDRISNTFPQVDPGTITTLTQTQAVSFYYSMLNGETIMQDTINRIADMIAGNNQLIDDLLEKNNSNTGIAVALGALLGITLS